MSGHSKPQSSFYAPSSSRGYLWKTKSYFPPANDTQSDQKSADFCADFPTHLLSRVKVILKTGAGEHEHTKAQLRTVTSCITNILIVSDLSEQLTPEHTAIDVLATLPSSYASSDNPDFATHVTQMEEYAKGKKASNSKAGWRLDRFKFLPMVELAFEMQPTAEWYVFIESDTYYFWDTLFRLLEQLDPHEPHYLGSPVINSGDTYFAYGGAGFVLSQGLMTRLVSERASEGKQRLSVRYQKRVEDDCCGDGVLAGVILEETGVRLQGVYPIFSGAELLAFRTDEQRWCVPLLALHRVSKELMKELWLWERTRKYNEKPILHSTILEFSMPHLLQPGNVNTTTRESWDNLSEDHGTPSALGKATSSSASACAEACASAKDCLQYSYTRGKCLFGKEVRLGKPVEAKKDDKEGGITSGWMTTKLAAMGLRADADINEACSEAVWLRPESCDEACVEAGRLKPES
ncbi:MAG: hypothetical protein Q9227_000540 [Pyrenula ochraceoflavens]